MPVHINFKMGESPYIFFNQKCPPINELLDNFDTIKSEFLALARRQKLAYRNKQMVLTPNPMYAGYNKTNQKGQMYKGTYKSIQLFMRSTLLDDIEKKNGNWQPDETERLQRKYVREAPFHLEWIRKYKDLVGAVNYNISYPGSRLSHHLGLNPNYIRLHMGVVVNDNACVFDIENWRYVWKERELMGFDDYYVYHGTNHSIESNSPRAILMIDLDKNYLKPYALNWPVRTERIPLKLLLAINPIKGWDTNGTT